MFIFGKSSLKNLEGVHKDLILIHREAIKTIKIDYGIHSGARTFNQQLELYKDGVSELDPRDPVQLQNAKHVTTPYRPYSLATDIHIASRYRNSSLAWNGIYLTYVIAYLTGIADSLYKEGRIKHKLRWGGNFKMDSVIQINEKFIDNDHIELIKV